MDQLVGADALDDLGRQLGAVAGLQEHVRRSQDRLGFGEAEFGTELDDEQVREQGDQALDLGRELGHVPGACIRSADVVGRDRVGVGLVAEGEIAGEEPHDVVTADAEVRLASLVDAVGEQQSRAEVADRHLGDVVDDHGLQARER